MLRMTLDRMERLSTGTMTLAAMLLSGCAATSMVTTATPAFTPNGGSFSTAQTVTVSDTTPGAVLYCTIDGSTPSTSSPVCSEPVTVYKSETLSAMAVAPGANPSAAATATFTITLPAATAPVISPAGGTFTAAQTIAITDATAGATIYYTTDGSQPSESSTVYGGPFMVAASQTVHAIAVSPATTESPVTTAAFTINLPAPTPVITPATGTYTSIQTATITDAAAGATIYYTVDGTPPTTSSTVYSGPITVAKTTTVQAIATAPGSSAGLVASATLTLNLPAAPTPVISPAGGNFIGSQQVTISDTTPSATIYYTTDGTTPTPSSAVYSGTITVANSETIKAIATAYGFSTSATASAAFTIGLAVPVISPAGGTFTSIQTATITDASANTTIYYTVDGTTPTTASAKYAAPITVAKSETIKAIAAATGFPNSAVASAAFTLNLPAAATPAISPNGGMFSSSQTVTITDATAGAVIYYTTDGTTPTAVSTKYTAPFAVDATESVKAIATATGFSTSATATAAFTFNQALAATPVLSPNGGTFTSTQNVTITDSTAGATIYYTTDGTTPTTASTKYIAAFTVSGSETVSAIATAAGFNNSLVASATFTLPTPTPVISPDGGSFASAQTVTLSDTLSTATIYYTTDGTTPTTSSTKYTVPFAVSSSETVKVIATATGSTMSAVASATFTLITGIPLSGTVSTGTTPISGATVQVYAAGTKGYGSAPTALLASPVTTTATGAFTVGITCPAAPGDQIYLVATGGSAGHAANAGIALMLALGSCGKLKSSDSFTVNEVTTVASVYALSAFAALPASGGGIDIGAPAPSASCISNGAATCNYTGLVNAFDTVGNLVDSGSGTALSVTPFYATGPVAALNTSTVPQARINTLANILAGCVEASNAAGCPALFSPTTPTGGTAPTDTLQAALAIATYPGTNVSKLYALKGLTPPYTPALAGAPNDFVLALTYTGGGLGLPFNFTSGEVNNTGMDIDAAGNIWVSAYNPSSASAIDVSSMVAKFSPLGEALTPATTQSTATPPVTAYGGYNPGTTEIFAPAGVAIDQSGNAWVEGDSLLFEVSPALAAVQSPISAYNSLLNAGGIVIDKKGDLWLAEGSRIEEYTDTGTRVSPSFPPTEGWNGQSTADGAGFTNVKRMIFDSTGATLWATDSGIGLYQITTANGSIVHLFSGNASALAADSEGNIYGCVSGTGTSLNVFDAKSTSIVNTYSISTGRGCGTAAMALDGAGHLFASSGGGFDEFTTTGMLLSPASKGYTGSGGSLGTDSDGNPLVEPTAVRSPNTALVDGSGNLWSLNPNTGSASVEVNVLTEFVGIAAPVVTPTSLALKSGELATRP